MSFDNIPEDREQSFLCPTGCGGNVKQDPKQGNQWQCDKCDWMPRMKIKKFVEISEEIEIDISTQDFIDSLSELPNQASYYLTLDGVNACLGFMQHIPSETIQKMAEGQRTVIQNALKHEAARYIK